jgi:glycosyltransferase involved in cell wall biosynthesis
MTDRLRILMLCPQFHPLRGGYEQAAERLGRALVQRGHLVSVLTQRRDRAWPRIEHLGGVEVRRLWCVSLNRLQTISALCSLCAFLVTRLHRYDVIHVHQYGWYSTTAILVGALFRVPVVLKLTSTGPSGIAPTLLALWPGRLHVWLHRFLGACIATSGRGEREALAIGIPERVIHRITNGLDTSRFTPASDAERARRRRELGLEDVHHAVTVCRLTPAKDLPMMLRAWKRVNEVHPEARLTIVGGGPLEDRLRDERAALGLDASVAMTGSVEDPLPWYQAGDLYLLTSTNEGLSNSLMEALSCGLPFVSTRVSGAEDAAECAKIGELVPVGDDAALARAIVGAIESPDSRAAVSRRAREYALDTYSMDSVCDQVEALYAGLVGDRPRDVGGR